MNKKVLTLCAGLFMAGGFVNFASAEKLVDFKGEVVKEVGGDAYFLLMEEKGSFYAYGLTDEDGDGKYTEDVIKLDDTEDDVDLENIKNYTWFVEEDYILVKENGKTEKQYIYALKNAGSGKYLTFTDEGKVEWADKFDKEKAETYVVLPGNVQYTGVNTQLNPGNWEATTNDYLRLNNTASPANSLSLVSQSNAGQFALYSVKSAEVTDELLNKLYNSAGFNLKLNQDKWKDVENIFADQRVKAIEITKPVEGSNGYAFPEGIYFVTETPKGAYDDADKPYDYLRGCTFIAVSPTENDINDAAQRAAGQGFALTLVSGEDLNTYVGEDGKKLNDDLVSEGAEISVYNACFKAAMKADESIQLSLGKFRYQEKANVGTHKEIKDKDVLLNVTAKDGDDHGDLRLTTDVEANDAFIFKFEEAFSVKPTEFLNENAKAVYTIKFVSGEDKEEEESEEGKYLYAPAYDSKNTMYAKGAEFVETSQPEAQWLITSVDGYNITFTNRANNDAEFTAKLYAEEDGAYSLAIKGGANNEKFNVLNVDKEGNMSATKEDVDLHQTWVELNQVSTDKFAGTWNKADETEVTMLFARDNTPTSNKLYVTFDRNDKGEITSKENISVTSKLSEALQFQLVKSKDSVAILNGYSYKVGDVVKYTDRRDTVAFYTYKLQAFHDGVAVTDKAGKDMFLGGYSNNKYKLTTNGADFIIKENVDGSVSILNTADDYAEDQFVAIEDWKGEKNTKNESFIEYYEGSDIVKGDLTEKIGANYVKTYLRIEAPEVSLDTDKSYVQIKSEVGGTYLSKNDENDAIMAAAAEAPMTIRVFATDTKKVVPSFYIATDWNANGERMFLFNPEDSVNYYVAEGEFNKKYQWNDKIGDDYATKVIFKKAYLDESLANLDTLSTEVKGGKTLVADVADDNQKVQGGLDKFKFQIVLAENEEDLYWIRQNGQYLRSINGKLTLSGDRAEALKVEVIDTDAPTANESINAASEAVQVVAANGAVIVKGAEGKNVVVSTILGKVVANEVLNSDNETIAAPAGIVVVSVDGESFKVAVK